MTQDIFERAEEFYGSNTDSGDRKAVPLYTQYLQSGTDREKRVLANLHLGHILEKSGNTDKAIEHYRQVVTEKPELSVLANAEYSLGHALIKAGEEDEGIEHITKATQLDPKYLNRLNDLIGTYETVLKAFREEHPIVDVPQELEERVVERVKENE